MTIKPSKAQERLLTLLRNINHAADKGEWDSLTRMSAELDEAVMLLVSQPPEQIDNAYRHSQLQELLALNEKTLRRCQARRSDIAPLVVALHSSKSAPS